MALEAGADVIESEVVVVDRAEEGSMDPESLAEDLVALQGIWIGESAFLGRFIRMG